MQCPWVAIYLHSQFLSCIPTMTSGSILISKWCCLWWWSAKNPDSQVRGANMVPIWGRQVPGGPHVGPMNFAIWEYITNIFENVLPSQWLGKKHDCIFLCLWNVLYVYQCTCMYNIWGYIWDKYILDQPIFPWREPLHASKIGSWHGISCGHQQTHMHEIMFITNTIWNELIFNQVNILK